jgi:hypothetical protein
MDGDAEAHEAELDADGIRRQGDLRVVERTAGAQ